MKSPHANDWTTLDPAIVSGQVADNLSHNLRSDSPPGWLKNNLDQITGDSVAVGGRYNGAGLISGLAGLGLGAHQQQQQTIGHWGQPSPVMSNTPPPGFAMNRVPGMQAPVGSQQPHPFSALAGLGGGNAGGPGNGAHGSIGDRDPALESELARLVRS